MPGLLRPLQPSVPFVVNTEDLPGKKRFMPSNHVHKIFRLIISLRPIPSSAETIRSRPLRPRVLRRAADTRWRMPRERNVSGRAAWSGATSPARRANGTPPPPGTPTGTPRVRGPPRTSAPTTRPCRPRLTPPCASARLWRFVVEKPKAAALTQGPPWGRGLHAQSESAQTIPHATRIIGRSPARRACRTCRAPGRPPRGRRAAHPPQTPRGSARGA